MLFILSLVTSGLLLGIASCVPDSELDLLQSLWKQTDSIGGEMTFTTEDGETVTVTITKNSDEVVVNDAEKNVMEKEDEKYEEKTTDSPDLNDILPSLNCINDVFRTLGIWEDPDVLYDEVQSWAQVAVKPGYTEETMYTQLKDKIEKDLHQA